MIALITGTIGIVTAIIIIILIRRDHLRVQFGLWWLGAAGMFAFLGFYPTIFDSFAKQVGVAYPPMLAVTLATVILVIKILLIDIEHSRSAVRVQRLTQRLALLESELREMQDTLCENKTDTNHEKSDNLHSG